MFSKLRARLENQHIAFQKKEIQQTSAPKAGSQAAASLPKEVLWEVMNHLDRGCRGAMGRVSHHWKEAYASHPQYARDRNLYRSAIHPRPIFIDTHQVNPCTASDFPRLVKDNTLI